MPNGLKIGPTPTGSCAECDKMGLGLLGNRLAIWESPAVC